MNKSFPKLQRSRTGKCTKKQVLLVAPKQYRLVRTEKQENKRTPVVRKYPICTSAAFDSEQYLILLSTYIFFVFFMELYKFNKLRTSNFCLLLSILNAQSLIVSPVDFAMLEMMLYLKNINL